jgi:hypothetical protein
MAVTPLDRQRASGFALVLDGGDRAGDPRLATLVAVVDSLRPIAEAGPAPSAEFRTALRARLLAVAAAAPAATPAGAQPTAQPLAGGAAGRWRTRLVAAAAGAALAVGCLGGLAVLSRNALPGDALYGVKRTVEGMQLSLTWSDEAKGRRELALADTRLGEVEDLLRDAGPRPTDASTVTELVATLDDLAAAAEHGSTLLTGVYLHSHEPAALESLRDFTEQHRGRLQALQPVLPAQLADRPAALIALLNQIDAQIAQLTAADPSRRTPAPGSVPGTGPGSGQAPATPAPGSSAAPVPGVVSPPAPGGIGPSPGGSATGSPPGETSSPSPSGTPGGGASVGVSLPPLLPGVTPTASVTLPPVLPSIPSARIGLGS